MSPGCAANPALVWAIEKAIPAGHGRGRSGGSAARETRAYFERLVAAGGGSSAVVPFDNDAKIRYDDERSAGELGVISFRCARKEVIAPCC